MADVTRIAYGTSPEAFGDLSLPDPSSVASTTERLPVVVLVHGGFWRQRYELDLMEPLVPSLVERGFAVWNIEYRRVSGGGGYPATLLDVADAIDHLAVIADDHRLDLDRVAVVGHSAGGHLATWLASRSHVPVDSVGANPSVLPKVVLSQAGVVDLLDAGAQRLGDGAAIDFMGAQSDQFPDQWRLASPIELLPIAAQVVLIHGALDDTVPLRQSERYLAAALGTGVDARLFVDESAGHFEHLDPHHWVWQIALAELDRAFGTAAS